MNLKELFQYFNSLKLNDLTLFYIDNKPCGYIIKNFREYLLDKFPNDFIFKNNILSLLSSYNTFDSRTKFFSELGKKLQQENILQLRNEDMLLASFCNKDLCKIDRTLTNYFGTKSSGIHINSYIEKNNKKYMWISKRSKLILDPLQYDNLVAGGVAFGYSVLDTIIKESEEEAGIPRELSIKCMHRGTFSYIVERYFGVRNDVVHFFDLELPENFIPKKQDDEVEDFYLFSLEELYGLISKGEGFKFNSLIVVANFLKEHSDLLNKEELSYLNKIMS